MKVKICGITNRDDAMCAVDLGVDALGFIFVKSSPRYIDPITARKIIHALPPFVVSVGVFADSSYPEILKIINRTKISCVQIHGEEKPGSMAKYHVPVYKSFRVDSSFDPTILRRYKCSAYLLDTKISGKLGGTGQTFNWEIAIKAKEYGRIILAGGLTPENIIEAVRIVHPYAVDINSGVEKIPGIKDHNKMKLLFKRLEQL